MEETRQKNEMAKRKNRFLILIVFLFLSLVHSNLLHALGPSHPFSSDEPEIEKCDLQTVSRVIDGDTLEISDGSRVRLTGVDTPETVDPRLAVQWFGREAVKKLKEWVEGKDVCLIRDSDRTQNVDKYGRLLRYVWRYATERGSSDRARPIEVFFVNAELIKQGYGFAYTRYPFQYLEEFRRHERFARKNNLGLWNRDKQDKWEKEVNKNRSLAKTCKKDVIICPEDAIHYKGRNKTVRFFVEKSYDSGKAIFLNSKNSFEDSDNFTAVIFEAHKSNFPPHSADFYWGKTVDVTGRVKEYRGRAEIILKHISQIKIVK